MDKIIKIPREFKTKPITDNALALNFVRPARIITPASSGSSDAINTPANNYIK